MMRINFPRVKLRGYPNVFYSTIIVYTVLLNKAELSTEKETSSANSQIYLANLLTKIKSKIINKIEKLFDPWYSVYFLIKTLHV